MTVKKWLWLIPTVILFLTAYFVIETPFEDKRYNNPIGEGITALEFRLADGSASIRLNDADAIDALRKATGGRMTTCTAAWLRMKCMPMCTRSRAAGETLRSP